MNTNNKREPSPNEKDFEKWRKEHLSEYDLDDNPISIEDGTKEILDEVKNATGEVIGETFKLNSPKKPFSGHETVNGIEISVGWDEYYQNYTIYLPQITINDDARDKGVYDQVIIATLLGSEAKKLFKKAKEMAKGCKDAYELYKKLGRYISYEIKEDEDDE